MIADDWCWRMEPTSRRSCGHTRSAMHCWICIGCSANCPKHFLPQSCRCICSGFGSVFNSKQLFFVNFDTMPQSFYDYICSRVVLGIGFCLMYPLLLLSRMEKRHDKERRQGFRRSTGLKPDKLPKHRRSLTASSIKSQETSPFLRSLPLEIRRLILQHCLAGNQFHLEIVKERLSANRCNSPTPLVCVRSGYAGCRASGLGQKFSCIALLQTCRTM